MFKRSTEPSNPKSYIHLRPLGRFCFERLLRTCLAKVAPHSLSRQAGQNSVTLFSVKGSDFLEPFRSPCEIGGFVDELGVQSRTEERRLNSPSLGVNCCDFNALVQTLEDSCGFRLHGKRGAPDRTPSWCTLHCPADRAHCFVVSRVGTRLCLEAGRFSHTAQPDHGTGRRVSANHPSRKCSPTRTPCS